MKESAARNLTVTPAGRRRRRASGATEKFPYERMQTELGRFDSRSARAAWYLNWAADHFPHEYQAYNVILQRIYDRKSQPRLDNDEVRNLRSGIHGVRKTLQKKYQRDLDAVASGARAMVDDDDAAAVALPKKMKRLRSAKNAVLATHALIDVTQIRNPELRAYMQRSAKDIVKIVGSPEFDRKLLTPGEETGDDAE